MTANTITAAYRLALVAALWTVLLAHSCTQPAVAHIQKASGGQDDQQGGVSIHNGGDE